MPSECPTKKPSHSPSHCPSQKPSVQPTTTPSMFPSFEPTLSPSNSCSNGAGGTFLCSAGMSYVEIARLACESVYGSCTDGSCGHFEYFYGESHRSCDCLKPIGQYEFIYSNTGYTWVGEDYNGVMADVTGNSLFVRRKTSPGCDANSWELALRNLGSLLVPSRTPTSEPTMTPCLSPTFIPSNHPSEFPTINRSSYPTRYPSYRPTETPSMTPSYRPTDIPSMIPSYQPTDSPSMIPSYHPTNSPSVFPSKNPTQFPSFPPTLSPTSEPSSNPSLSPTTDPSTFPSSIPTRKPSAQPTDSPSYTWILHRDDGHCSNPRQQELINGRSENYRTQPFTLEYCKSECGLLGGKAVSYRANDGWCRCEDRLSVPDSPDIEDGWECWIISEMTTTSPTASPSASPTASPTVSPTASPSTLPTVFPTESPDCSAINWADENRCGPSFGDKVCVENHPYCSNSNWCGDTDEHNVGRTDYDFPLYCSTVSTINTGIDNSGTGSTSCSHLEKYEDESDTRPHFLATIANLLEICGNSCSADLSLDDWDVCGLADGQLDGPSHGSHIERSSLGDYGCWVVCTYVYVGAGYCRSASNELVNGFRHDEMPLCREECEKVAGCLGYALNVDTKRCYVYADDTAAIPVEPGWEYYDRPGDNINNSSGQVNVECHRKLYASPTVSPSIFPSLSPSTIPSLNPSISAFDYGKADMFDPNSTLTNYMDQSGCGPRGRNAQADLTQCAHGARIVVQVANDNWAVQVRIDGCGYYSYTVYACNFEPWMLLRQGVECGDNSNERFLGAFGTVSECAEACYNRSECTTFTFVPPDADGGNGPCMSEGISESNCTTWIGKPSGAFYTLLVTDPCQCPEGQGFSTTDGYCKSGSTTECFECPDDSRCIEGACSETCYEYDPMRTCQCIEETCIMYGNCCSDVDKCVMPCSPNYDNPYGLLCSDGTLGAYNDWHACGSSYENQEACPIEEDAYFTCNSGKCEKNATNCSDGVRYGVDLCIAVDGGYSEWSEWSSCSKSCDGGFISRTRLCNAPPATNGGLSCDDQELGFANETLSCNNVSCVNCNGLDCAACHYEERTSWNNWCDFLTRSWDASTLQQCKDDCSSHEECMGFVWSPLNGGQWCQLRRGDVFVENDCSEADPNDQYNTYKKMCGAETKDPTFAPSTTPTREPTKCPSQNPTVKPTRTPTTNPTFAPSTTPTLEPTKCPSTEPSTIDWQFCALENMTCVCFGEVRYGALSTWSTLYVNESVTCSQDIFGDPTSILGVPGLIKLCQCKSEYVLGAMNSRECPEGYEPILQKAECHKACDIAGYFAHHSDRVGQNYIHGCIASSVYCYFNDNPNDDAAGLVNRRRICKLVGSSCERPSGWCMHEGSTYGFTDCDGDGVADPVCKDSLGQFGIIQSANGCEDSWPNGNCVETEDPTFAPSTIPTREPTKCPSQNPTGEPSKTPTTNPSTEPSNDCKMASSRCLHGDDYCTSTNQCGPNEGDCDSDDDCKDDLVCMSDPEDEHGLTGGDMADYCMDTTRFRTTSKAIISSNNPTAAPTLHPSNSPTVVPTLHPTYIPSNMPTNSPEVSTSTMSAAVYAVIEVDLKGVNGPNDTNITSLRDQENYREIEIWYVASYAMGAIVADPYATEWSIQKDIRNWTRHYFDLSYEDARNMEINNVTEAQATTVRRNLQAAPDYWIVEILSQTWTTAESARSLATNEAFMDAFNIEDLVVTYAEGDESIDAEVLFIVEDARDADLLLHELEELGFDAEMRDEANIWTTPQPPGAAETEIPLVFVIGFYFVCFGIPIICIGCIFWFLCIRSNKENKAHKDERELTEILSSTESTSGARPSNFKLSAFYARVLPIKSISMVDGPSFTEQLEIPRSSSVDVPVSRLSTQCSGKDNLYGDLNTSRDSTALSIQAGDSGRMSSTFEGNYGATSPYRFSSTFTSEREGEIETALTPGSPKVDKIAFEKLKLLEEIGEGAFGKVWKARWLGATVAVKAVGNQENSNAIHKEAELLQELAGFPHVCHVSGVSEDPATQKIYIVTNYYEHGSMDQYFKKFDVSQELKYKFIHEACLGVRFLHDRGVVHRDIACRNFLIDDRKQVAIADFGISRKLGRSSTGITDIQRTRSVIGPVRWMAIESIQKGEYSTYSDVWMLAVTIWEILSDCDLPWGQIPNEMVIFKVMSGDHLTCEDSWDESLCAMLRLCWSQDPKKRPDAGRLSDLCEALRFKDMNEVHRLASRSEIGDTQNAGGTEIIEESDLTYDNYEPAINGK